MMMEEKDEEKTAKAAEDSHLLPRDMDVATAAEGDDALVPGYAGTAQSRQGCARRHAVLAWVLAGVFAAVAAALGVVLVLGAAHRLGPGTCPASARPPSVVLFIGDGFGPQMTSLARLFVDAAGRGPEPFAALAEPRAQCRVAFTQTRSASAVVTDSAAAGTALATAHKTVNGRVGVDAAGAPVGSVLEAAKLAGYATGAVVTSAVTHATPAAFTAHAASRDAGELIALQQATLQTGVIDVLVGGGRAHYAAATRADGRDLIAELRTAGYTVAQNRTELLAAERLPLVALLAPGHLAYAIDRTNHDAAARDAQPTLRESVDKALALLRADGRPFFLMVEGSKIDMAAHTNDAAAAVHEALAYADALSAAVADAQQHGDTLVLATSDHDTGGLSIAATVDLAQLHAINASCEHMAATIRAAGSTDDAVTATLAQYTPIADLTAAEIAHIRDAVAAGSEYAGANAVAEVVSARLGLEWGAHDHTATNVLTYTCLGGWRHAAACIPDTALPPVLIDNTDIPRFISNRCRASLESATKRAVEVFTGHTTVSHSVPSRASAAVDPAVDPVDTEFHMLSHVQK